MSVRRKAWIAAAGLVAALALVVLWPSARTMAFLMDIAGRDDLVRTLIPVRLEPVSTTDLEVPTRDGPLSARLYQPTPATTRLVVVFPGIHSGGVDEPRLARFSARLAATGFRVLSVPLPELREYVVTGRSTDAIEDVTRWAATTIAPTGRVVLVGVSFSGGLALVAAGRPSLAGRITLVLSLGGHGDLPRVLHYLCTGTLPDGAYRKPHEYGLGIIALGAVPRLVPAAEGPALTKAIRDYLDAGAEKAEDTPDSAEPAMRALAAVRDETDALPEPARTIMAEVASGDLATLGRQLDPWVDDLAADPALSPDRSPVTTAPVFLLHGSDDNVVPSSETPLVAAFLTSHGNRQVRALLTPALSHALLLPRVSPADEWALVRFWHAMTDAAQ